MTSLDLINQTKSSVSKKPFEALLTEAEKIVPELKKLKSLELCLADNKSIQKLNKKYRRKNAPTDVLSFDDPPQIVISVEKAREQAREIGQSLTEELRFLFAHGLLHILGYDHEKAEDEAIMLKKAYAILGRKNGRT